jgi:hypothetical protein
VEETASLASGDGTADDEAVSVLVIPLDPLDGDILSECPRVDPHDGDDPNLFFFGRSRLIGYPGTLVRGGSTVSVLFTDSVRMKCSLSLP